MPSESDSPRTPATGSPVEDIAAKSFPTARRGLDAAAVHRYLMEVASTLRDARRREDILRGRLEDLERTDRRQPPVPLDEDTLTAALGEETVRVLQSAREAGREIAAKAEQRANALIADAESALAERSRYADAEAEALLARARAEASAYLESTKEQARAMVLEAREARRRILSDLADRRRTMQIQLEQLRAGKETLSEILDGVSGSIFSTMEGVRTRLEAAEEDARASASAATPAARDDRDLRLDDGPELAEPPLSAELRASLAGEPSRFTNQSRQDGGEFSDSHSASAKTQGIDELFARIRESRQLEVAETRAQMEAVEREIYAALPPQPADPMPLRSPTPPSTSEVSRIGDDAALSPTPAPSTLFSPTPSLLDQRSETPQPPSESTSAGLVEAGHGPSDDVEPSQNDAEPTLFDQRDDLLSPAAGELSRALKRSLRLEQNELLDAARQLKRSGDAIMLLPGEQMAERIAVTVSASLDAAWHAGELFVDGVLGLKSSGQAATGLERNSELVDIAQALSAEIVDPIRRRMEAGLAHAGADDGAVHDAIGSAFRDWRASRIDDVAGDFTHRVFARSIVHSSRARNAKVRWLVDDGDLECPDCDDNALAGPAIAGSLFPTGHSHPPVHPGCRCILVPISR